jgi:hypothetical protein
MALISFLRLIGEYYHQLLIGQRSREGLKERELYVFG